MTMTMTIIMTMNIYINRSNTEKLEKEANKSGLINRLLEEYFNSLTKPHPVLEPELPPEDKNSSTPINKSQKEINKSPKEINKSQKDYSLCKHSFVKGFCKEGCK